MMPVPRTAFGLASILFALHLPAMAQQRMAQPYLPALMQAEAAVAQLPADAFGHLRSAGLDASVRQFSGPLQQLGTFRAMAGDIDGAIAAFDIRDRTERPVRPAEAAQFKLVEDAVAEDAIKAIIAQARTRRVVLLNEAHHMPMHRAFAQKLAAELRKIGYEYLAAEAFGGEGDITERARNSIPRRLGLYTQDPVFAGFIESAVADKWKLIAYEVGRPAPGMSPQQASQEREAGQARNLVEHIFSKDKDAKVFIYVGYSHLNKSPEGDTLPLMMGEHLRRMTRLDTLHVQQIDFYAHPDRRDETPLYPLLLAKFPSNQPFVLRAPDGSRPILRGLQGRIDMQVVFPRYALRDGRPEWLASLAGREPRAIPAHLLPATGRRAILAHRIDAVPDAVPADVVLVESGKPVPKLMLPPGEFRFSFEE